jgi:hypothetical protein
MVWSPILYNLAILIFFIHCKVLLWYHSILTKILESFDVQQKFFSTVAAVVQKDYVLVLKFYFIFYFCGHSLGTT